MAKQYRQPAQILALILAMSGLLVCAQPAAAIIFTDGDFVPTQWQGQAVNFGNTSASASTLVGGGAPGGFRLISLNSSWQWLQPQRRVMWVDLKTSATVTPGALGGITNVDYVEDQKCSCFIAGILWGPVVEQNGAYYIVTGNAMPNTMDLTWDTFALAGLTATDFEEIQLTGLSWTNPSSHPDFSAAGAPVTFGYGRGMAYDTTIDSSLDNWTVAVNETAVATTTTQWGTLKGLYR